MRLCGSRLRLSSSVLAIATAAVLTGCGPHEGSQDVARGKNLEVSTSELDQMLARAPDSSRAKLDRLRQFALDEVINQKLMAKQAHAEGFDRDAEVMESLQAAKREVLARTYAQKITSQLPAPKPSDVDAFYDGNPALFSARKIAVLNEMRVVGTDAQIAKYKALFDAHSSLEEVQSAMRAAGVEAPILTADVPPESVPLAFAAQLSKLSPQAPLIFDLGQGETFAILQRLDAAPVSREQARPAIMAMLKAQAAKELVAKQVAILRKQADVKYVGHPVDNGTKAAKQ